MSFAKVAVAGGIIGAGANAMEGRRQRIKAEQAKDNAEKAKNMIKNIIENFENHIDPKDPANNCLDVAIITAPEKRTQKTKDKLKTIAGRVLNK